MTKARVLIADDDDAIRFGVREYLESSGFEILEAETCAGAQQALESDDLDAAIVDYSMPDGTALEVLQAAQRLGSHVPILVLTGNGSIDLAVQAIKEGAEHFLTKPIDLASLLVVLDRTLEHQRYRRRAYADRTSPRLPDGPLGGDSPTIRELTRQARRVAASDLPVLIQGETGSGKGVLARWIQQASPRAREPHVDLNCAGLPRDLLESELFGHERGAFTGAVAAKPGLIEAAHRGTMFLDEIGDMELAVQPKLLKVLEEKKFRRLGDVRERTANVRFIAATHHDLPKLVAEGRFREDLYFRLNVITLYVPPLRERVDDIAGLAVHMLGNMAADLGRQVPRLTAESEELLRRHSWPGNVRELRNVLERALLLHDGNVLGPGSISLARKAAVASAPDGQGTLLEIEIRHVRQVLEQEGHNVDRAAILLGIPRSSLYQKVKRFGIDLPRSAREK